MPGVFSFYKFTLLKIMDISKKEFEHSEKITFQSDNEDDYSTDNDLRELLSERDGIIQIVIPFTDTEGNERYYSKSFFNDSEEMRSGQEYEDWIQEMIDITFDFFEDDAETYGVGDVGTAGVVLSAGF